MNLVIRKIDYTGEKIFGIKYQSKELFVEAFTASLRAYSNIRKKLYNDRRKLDKLVDKVQNSRNVKDADISAAELSQSLIEEQWKLTDSMKWFDGLDGSKLHLSDFLGPIYYTPVIPEIYTQDEWNNYVNIKNNELMQSLFN